MFMTRIIAAAALCVCATSATAAEGSAIGLFDGETLFGWNAMGTAEWTIDDGVIKCREGSSGFLATTSQFKDFVLSLKVRLKEGATTGIVVRGGLEGHQSENGSTYMFLREPDGGGDDWHDVVIRAEGGNVTATVDGEAADITKGSRNKGYILLQYHHNNNAKVEFRDISLTPLSFESILNDDNLDGWNIIPDHASKFTIKDGILNIIDGNGQIETDKLYRDFVLQLDIKSNGEHLNSGVFFRGPKGIFWKGYESQVRNQWSGDDRTRPVDYGTGGIYANQATRKVVPSDGEWFTKTVVVNDNHMAVWINGYQVSDFIDTRPHVDNGDGKAGYVTDGGTIHLQGHDPTTDLDFTKIIISEY